MEPELVVLLELELVATAPPLPVLLELEVAAAPPLPVLLELLAAAPPLPVPLELVLPEPCEPELVEPVLGLPELVPPLPVPPVPELFDPHDAAQPRATRANPIQIRRIDFISPSDGPPPLSTASPAKRCPRYQETRAGS